MNDHDAFWHEMAGSTSPQRLGHEPVEQVLDCILAGQPLPPSADHGMQVLTSKLSELAAPAGAGTLTGETAAMSAYRHRFSPASTLPLPVQMEPATVRHRRDRWLAAGRARFAAVVVVLAMVLGGGSVAAYARDLPRPVQELAHKLIGAPPPPAHRSAGHRPGTHAGQPDGPAHMRGSGRSLSGVHKSRGRGPVHGKAAGHKKKKGHPAHPANPGKGAGKNKVEHSRAVGRARPKHQRPEN